MPDLMNDILVVDDNPVLLTVLAEILKEYGYTVRTASDGFSALAFIRDRTPDILLSDLYMPGMSGFELLSVVRRRFPAIAVIAMSGTYFGATVPPGIAADGFYAKASSGIERLFEIISTIADPAIRLSTRAATPIWIPRLPIDHADLSTIAVACPECLRTFPHRLDDAAPPRAERHCPHCSHPVQLAVVRQVDDTDKTLPALSTMPARTSESTARFITAPKIYAGYPLSSAA